MLDDDITIPDLSDDFVFFLIVILRSGWNIFVFDEGLRSMIGISIDLISL